MNYTKESIALGEACLNGDKVPVAVPVQPGKPEFRLQFWDAVHPNSGQYRIELSSLSNMANSRFRLDQDLTINNAVQYIISQR